MTFFDFFQSSGAIEVEIVRLVYIISLLISLWVYYEREHSPGGIITAGSVLLLLGSPVRILFLFLTTLLIIPIHQFIEQKVLTKYILVTREKMLLRVFISIVISAILYVLFYSVSRESHLGVLGTVSPALLAGGLSNKERRKETLISFLYAVIIGILTYIIIKIIYIFFVPNSYLYFISGIYRFRNFLDFWSVITMYFLFASITGYNFWARRSQILAPVGLMIGGYLGILILQPLQILFIMVAIGVSSLIVRNIDRVALLYGYRLFVLASLVSASIYILMEMMSIIFFDFYPLKGVTLAGIVVVSVVTAELSQNKFSKVLISYISMFFFAGLVFLLSFGLAYLSTSGNIELMPVLFREYVYGL